MSIDKAKLKEKFMQVSYSQHRINITMHCLDKMLLVMPEQTAWRGWRYKGWSDEEIVFFRDWLYMHGGWRRYENKKAPTTLLPRTESLTDTDRESTAGTDTDGDASI